MVRAHFILPEGVTVEYREGGAGSWIPLVDVFGPTNGFPLSNIITTFRGTFEKAGTFDVTVEFREVGTNALVGSKTFAATRYRRNNRAVDNQTKY